MLDDCVIQKIIMFIKKILDKPVIKKTTEKIFRPLIEREIKRRERDREDAIRRMLSRSQFQKRRKDDY